MGPLSPQTSRLVCPWGQQEGQAGERQCRATASWGCSHSITVPPLAASSPAPEQPITHCSPRLRPLAPGTAQLSSACQPQTHSCLSKPSLSTGRCFPPVSPSSGSSQSLHQPPTRDSVHCCQKPHDDALNGGDDTFPSSPTHRSPACALLGPDAHTPGFRLPRAWGRQPESGSQSHVHTRTHVVPSAVSVSPTPGSPTGG